MIVTLLILNLLCGVWNSVISTVGGNGINGLFAALNWLAVGSLAYSIVNV